MRPIRVTQSTETSAAVSDVFALASGARLPVFIRPAGPLPGVARIEGVADWARPGETRRLLLTDGSSLNEELTAIDRDRSFAYRAMGFSGPFGALVREGRGEWVFSQSPGGVGVVWSYAFTPRGPLAAPLLELIVRLLWPGYMRAALARLKAEAEKDGARP